VAAITTANWASLADRALAGEPLAREEALAILRAPNEELLSLLAAAFRVRRAHFGLLVKLNMIVNAKSGICPEDCGYCSQSIVSRAQIPKHTASGRRPRRRSTRGVGAEGPHVLHRRQRPRAELS
jgi:2-iminoacetate synthase ThiH